jgi:ABC-type multidrug transport system fused ATPase/permease subunit
MRVSDRGSASSGKTTLLQVLARLLDYEGTLLINDIDARHYEPSDLHAAMAACFQDHSKYPLTLRENILCGNRARADDAQALQVAIDVSGVSGFLDEGNRGTRPQSSSHPRLQCRMDWTPTYR